MKHRFVKPAILLLALCCLLLLFCGRGVQKYVSGTGSTYVQETTEAAAEVSVPWRGNGNGKMPAAYTMQEYEDLTPEQQKAFQEDMGTDEYEQWLRDYVLESEDLPWKKEGAKQPEDYTWEEYQALTDLEKQAFMAHLGPYGLEAWMQKVKPDTSGDSVQDDDNTQTDNNNNKSNAGKITTGKNPMDYTWEEYQALSEQEKKDFVARLGASGFEKWLTKVQGEKVSHVEKITYPWEKAGAKQPKDYTLEEYEKLTADQKKAFQKHMGTENFKKWQEKFKQEKNPWDKAGAKQPKDYTWEEYQALTEKQKKAFQEHLGARKFENWREKLFAQEEYPWEKENAKQPGDYTWKEYKALTSDQQYEFRRCLGTSGVKDWLKGFTELPWEEEGAKQPNAYTLKEFKALTEQQQMGFENHLGAAGFDAWQEEVQRKKETYPWDQSGAKQPEDYTLAEYNALTAAQQMAFQNHLGAKGFEEWQQSMQEKNPWEKPDAKQPADYTKAEYEALTAAQQMAFQNHLGPDAFAAWMSKYETKQESNPWEKPDAKQPADYTKAEYEALTAAQQMAFQAHLGADGFAAWVSKGESKQEKNPWDAADAKQPAEYTMEEFEALTAAQQMAFQAHLGADGFAAWLSQFENQSNPEANPWDAPDAKQPAEYTREEFEALTAAQQMAFQAHLGADGFAAWLNRDQEKAEANPWDAADAKQPAEYTWEEFNDLTAAQQMAFQEHLGPEGFEAWLVQQGIL